ncbi:MAG: hypothetical protein RLZZ324_608, partial [Candidatus Parcubacteria bacterium]
MIEQKASTTEPETPPAPQEEKPDEQTNQLMGRIRDR